MVAYRIKIAVIFVILFYALYGAASFISQYNPFQFRLWLPFEANIPFYPWFSVFYLAVGLPGILLVSNLTTRYEINLLLKIMLGQTAFASIMFIILPLQLGFQPGATHETTNWFYQLADTVNLERNQFPSLHVTFTVTTSTLLMQYLKPVEKLLMTVVAFCVVLSTLLIHEHHLIDIGGGVLLAWYGVYRWKTATRTAAAAST